MKQQSKFKNLSQDLDEVPNSELHKIKGGNQHSDELVYSETGSLKPEDEQLLIYGSSNTFEEDTEEWDIEELQNQEQEDFQSEVQSFRSGEGGEGEEEGGEGEEDDEWPEGYPHEAPVVIIGEPPAEPGEPTEEPWEPWEPVEEPPAHEPVEEDWGTDEPTEPTQPTEDPETPCEKAAAVAAEILDLLNEQGVQDTLDYIHTVQDNMLPWERPDEVGFTITRDLDGEVRSSFPSVGGPTVVDIENTEYSIAELHTHANSNNPPGTSDLMSFLQDRLTKSPGLDTSFTLTQNGTIYAMQITDYSLISDFFYTNGTSNNYDTTTGEWTNNSYMKYLYDRAHNQFSSNLDPLEAQERAFAAVLERAGVSLFKTDENGDLKKIGTSESQNAAGQPVFSVNDCP